MFWKGPVFTRDGFKGSGLNLESCDIVDRVDGEENGIIVPLFRNCHTHLGAVSYTHLTLPTILLV